MASIDSSAVPSRCNRVSCALFFPLCMVQYTQFFSGTYNFQPILVSRFFFTPYFLGIKFFLEINIFKMDSMDWKMKVSSRQNFAMRNSNVDCVRFSVKIM